MNNVNTKEKLIKSLENVGIFIDINDSCDIDLSNYIEDSLQFMSFIIELENIFVVEIPDEFLIFDNFKYFDAICDMMNELIKSNTTV